MSKLVEIAKEFGKYELGLNDIKIWKKLMEETTRLKAKYGFSYWDS